MSDTDFAPASNVIALFGERDDVPETPLRNWSADDAQHGNRRRFSIDEVGPPVDGMVSFEATVPAEILRSALILLSVPGAYLVNEPGDVIKVHLPPIKKATEPA